jgi:hypothetical protein
MFWCMGVLMSPRDEFEPEDSGPWVSAGLLLALIAGAWLYVKVKGWSA